jgi:hypothetical protein
MTHIDQATNAALNFPLTRIAARYQQLYDVPHHEVLRHERELKRYLLLRSRSNADTLPTPRVVDQLWHVFLLYTRDYAEFCDLLGGGFIHHVPTESSPDVAEMTARYREMLAEYEEVFRESPPSDVWPALGAAGRFSDCDAARTGELSDCDSAIEID